MAVTLEFIDTTPIQELITAKHFEMDLIMEKILMNYDLSPSAIQKELAKRGYQVVERNVESPVGDVPEGSTVYTDYNEKRAIWINGNLWQHPKAK